MVVQVFNSRMCKAGESLRDESQPGLYTSSRPLSSYFKEKVTLMYSSCWGWKDGSEIKSTCLAQDPGLLPRTHIVAHNDL